VELFAPEAFDGRLEEPQPLLTKPTVSTVAKQAHLARFLSRRTPPLVSTSAFR
jgi:hypothetical protein